MVYYVHLNQAETDTKRRFEMNLNLKAKVQQVLNQHPVAQSDLLDGGVEWESSPMFTELDNTFAESIPNEVRNGNSGNTASWIAEWIFEHF